MLLRDNRLQVAPRRAFCLGDWALGVRGARRWVLGDGDGRAVGRYGGRSDAAIPGARTVVPPYRLTALPSRLTAGFTLIEMLVVIVVMAVLASVVGPMVFRNVGDAKQQAARAQIELLGMALDAYRLDNGSYPSTDQGLAALWTRPELGQAPPRWRGPYTKKQVPLDPWDRPYVYRSPGDSMPAAYDLVTYGRDGQPGGADEDADVTSWGGR